MTQWTEDERDWTDRITLPMIAAFFIVCMGLFWINVLFSYFPSNIVVWVVVAAGVIGYGIFRGLKWLSRRSRPAAVAVLLYVIGVIVFLWPTACVTAGGKFGTPIKHYCRCEGLTVTTGPDGYDVTITTYCLGWETKDVWEERIDLNILN